MEHKILMAQNLRQGIAEIKQRRIQKLWDNEYLMMPWTSIMYRENGTEIEPEDYQRIAMAFKASREIRNDWHAAVLRARIKMQMRKQEAA